MEPNSQRMEEGMFTNIGTITVVSLLPDVDSIWITCALLVDTQLPLQLHLSGEKERHGGSNRAPLERRELSLQKRRRLFETVDG
jgi:hypothetical protein